MSVKSSKRLVIDVSVAIAAGGKYASHPTSKNCRDFLKSILSICHHAVMTQEINEEWEMGISRFTKKWLGWMQRRNKILRVKKAPNDEIRDQIKHSEATETQKIKMEKDRRLIEAALKTDKIIISLDDEARELFKKLTGSSQSLKKIVWVNPDKLTEAPIHWLENGAKHDEERQLGSSS